MPEKEREKIRYAQIETYKDWIKKFPLKDKAYNIPFQTVKEIEEHVDKRMLRGYPDVKILEDQRYKEQPSAYKVIINKLLDKWDNPI